jgi:hypothetical protein
MKVSQTDLRETTIQTQDSNEIDNEDWIESCESYYAIADIGFANHAFIATKSSFDSSYLANTGANCCMTPNLLSLQSVEPLREPITVGVAVIRDKNPTFALCTHIGVLPVLCDDGSQILTKCFYNPFASDTIISPQAIIDASTNFHTWKQTGRKFGMAGTLDFISYSTTKTITLSQHNGLYYCSAGVHPILKEPTDDFELNHTILACRLHRSNPSISPV